MIQTKQRGIGFIGFIVNLSVIAFVVIYGLQIGLGYITKNTIEKSVISTLLEFKELDKTDPKKVEDSIVLKLEMNNIDISRQDIIVTRDSTGTGFNVQIKYEKSVGINDDLSINMEFLIDEYTP